MLQGTYEGRMDAQGRIVIPQRCREPFEGEMFVVRGLDGNIDMYPAAEWHEEEAKLQRFSGYNTEARLAHRLLFSGSFPAQMDRQGRVVIPPMLRQYASIQEEVVVAGAGRKLELWSKDRWAVQEAQAPNLPKIASALELIESQGKRP